MRHFFRLAHFSLLGCLLTPVFAAEPTCVAPTTLAIAQYDVAPEEDKKPCLNRQVNKQADYFILVFSWSPGFCKPKIDSGNIPPDLKFQCVDNDFKWVVHGLWAELNEPEACVVNRDKPNEITPLHPRYCQGNLPQLDSVLVKSNMCTVPGAKLIQGEWEKHGACIYKQPNEYFAKIRELRGQLVLPDSMMPQNQLFKWMRDNNAILHGVSLDYDPKPNELHVCYNKSWQPMDCPGTPPQPQTSTCGRGTASHLAKSRLMKGRDGKAVKIPEGYRGKQGNNGHMVAIPPGGEGREGKNGQMVAIPQHWRGKEGHDGVMVAIPPGGQGRQGKDGRMVAIPKHWRYREGANGRVVAIPPPGWNAQELNCEMAAVAQRESLISLNN
jgi:ribonuclease T2